MDHDRSDGDDVRGFFDAGQRIEEQGFAESSSLLRPIHGQAGQQDDQDWMVGEPLADPLRTLMLVNGAGGQRVIAHYAITFESHVRSCRVCLLIGPRVPLQPDVEGRVPTIEAAQVVSAAQLVDDELGYGAHERRLAMCGSLNRRRSRGLSFAGRSKTAMKAFHCWASRTKRVWSASTCSAFSRALRMINSVRLTPCRSAATLMSVSSEAVARSWKRRSRGWSGVDMAIGPSISIVLPMYSGRSAMQLLKASLHRESTLRRQPLPDGRGSDWSCSEVNRSRDRQRAVFWSAT